MGRPETLRLLRASHDEIVTLRRRVSELEPKAHAYETLSIFARQSIHPESQGYGVDIAWELKKAVEEIVAEREAEALKGQTP